MRLFALCVVSCFALTSPCIVAAQQAPVGTAPKDPGAPLRQWLRETAAGGPTAFEVRWQPLAAAAADPVALPEVRVANGTFAPDVLHVQVQGDREPAWLQVGRHCLVREPDGPWCLRKGSTEGIDPPLLLRALAAEVTTVAARTIVEREGAAVEQFTLCLTPAQADRLVDAGAIHETSQARMARALLRSGRVTADQVPVPTVDVCCEVDVATHRLRRLHLRAVSAPFDARKALLNPAARRAAAAEVAEVPAAAEPVAAAVPLPGKDGLPVRDLEGQMVVWIELVLRDHDKAAAVVLDDTQRQLLGR